MGIASSHALRGPAPGTCLPVFVSLVIVIAGADCVVVVALVSQAPTPCVVLLLGLVCLCSVVALVNCLFSF